MSSDKERELNNKYLGARRQAMTAVLWISEIVLKSGDLTEDVSVDLHLHVNLEFPTTIRLGAGVGG